MLGLGSVFKRAYGDYFAAWSPQKNARMRPVWGDEWVESSVNTLWYPCNWRNVSEDELVLLIPSLASQSWSKADAHGPSRHLRRALTARLRWVVSVFSPLAGDEGCSDESALEIIARSGAVTTIDVRQALASSAADYAEFYGDPALLLSPRHSVTQPESPVTNASRERWISELTILACLDRLLRDSMSESDGPIDDRRSDDSFGLTEILLATIYASFNGAYIYRQFAGAHELLSVGAWLGHILRGRAAIMPEFIAEYVVDHFSRVPADAESADKGCDRLLHTHGDLAIGSKRLLRIAKRVKKSGTPSVVRPADRHVGQFAKVATCTERLSHNIARRLNLDLQHPHV